MSFCAYAEGFNPVISLNGKAVFVEDVKLKAQALDENPDIKELFKTPDNPVFKLFSIDTEEVVTFSFAEGSKTRKL